MKDLLQWLGQGENGWMALLIIGAIFSGLVAVIRAIRGQNPNPWADD